MMTNYDFYAIFVGCGHGCDLAARILGKAGKRIAAVERDLWFGTCTKTQKKISSHEKLPKNVQKHSQKTGETN